jgi:hypothetical protein
VLSIYEVANIKTKYLVLFIDSRHYREESRLRSNHFHFLFEIRIFLNEPFVPIVESATKE